MALSICGYMSRVVVGAVHALLEKVNHDRRTAYIPKHELQSDLRSMRQPKCGFNQQRVTGHSNLITVSVSRLTSGCAHLCIQCEVRL